MEHTVFNMPEYLLYSCYSKAKGLFALRNMKLSKAAKTGNFTEVCTRENLVPEQEYFDKLANPIW